MKNQVQTHLPDNNKIIAGDDQDFNYWSNKFGIEKSDLIAMVKRGGTFSEAVEKYVKSLKFAS